MKNSPQKTSPNKKTSPIKKKSPKKTIGFQQKYYSLKNDQKLTRLILGIILVIVLITLGLIFLIRDDDKLRGGICIGFAGVGIILLCLMYYRK